MRIKSKKILCLFLLVILCPTLSGCRVRTGEGGQSPSSSDARSDPAIRIHESGPAPEASPDPENNQDEQKKNEEAGGQTKENLESSRKEYDENAPAEIVPGTDRTLTQPGEGSAASRHTENAENAEQSADTLNDSAEKTAVQTVAAEEAEKMGVSEDADEAESAMTYFSVLLKDRTDSLFECQRLTLYWETAQDHVTVHKTSLEHSLILETGSYDVSARLLPENLRVDDGWIGRKNPGVIVKVTDRNILGTGVHSSGAARKVYSELLAREGWASIDAVRSGRVLLLSEELLETPYLRTAAELMIAKVSNPGLFLDVDLEEALNMLAEEATGVLPSGLFYYHEQGGI